jgi:hypothetical protein
MHAGEYSHRQCVYVGNSKMADFVEEAVELSGGSAFNLFCI